MLKYFVLVLISITCLASEPKFHFMDCVKIVDGFYKGCSGNVRSYRPSSQYNGAAYDVDVENCRDGTFYDYFYENELEACKK